MKSNVDILVSNGLGPRAHQDFLLAFNTCSALLKISSKSKVHNEGLQTLCILRRLTMADHWNQTYL